MARHQPVMRARNSMWSAGLVGLGVLLAASPAGAYGNKTAHPTINDLAEDLFYQRAFPKLSTIYQGKYDKSSIDGEFPAFAGLTFVNSGYFGVSSAEDVRRYSYYAWFERGGHDADEPELYMSFRHFYDPVLTPRYLTDQMPDSTYPNPKIDARTWIGHPDNRYSWTKALLLYKAALENKITDFSAYGSDREALFAAAFRAVGETMHLVADMALPAHVRDDSHPFSEPYEDTVDRWMIQEIIGTDCNHPEGPAIPAGVVTANQTPAELMNALATYTNRTFFSDETISDKASGIVPARTGPDLVQATKTYDSPQISTLTKQGNTYYATIMGKQIPLAQDSLLGVTLGNMVWAAYRSPAALARKQAEILVPLAVTACSEVINAFFPQVISEVTVTANKTTGKHTVKATLSFQGTRAWQEEGIATTYNGPVQILRNGVQDLDLDVVGGEGTIDVTGWKKDDQVQLLLRVGGLRIESPIVSVPDASNTSTSFTKSYPGQYLYNKELSADLSFSLSGKYTSVQETRNGDLTTYVFTVPKPQAGKKESYTLTASLANLVCWSNPGSGPVVADCGQKKLDAASATWTNTFGDGLATAFATDETSGVSTTMPSKAFMFKITDPDNSKGYRTMTPFLVKLIF